MKKVNVLLYSRVSTDIQDTSRQEADLEAVCKEKGYTIVKRISEKVSGKVPYEEREISKVFDEVEIDGVLVSELSRLGRNTKDILTIISKLKERNVWLYAHHEKLRTIEENGKENLMSNLLLTILSGIADLERDTILERSVSGLENSVRKGNWTGGVFLPYGYKRVNKKLVIDEEEAKVIEKIFSLCLSGYGTTRISNVLNQLKIPTRYNKVVKKTIKVSGIQKEGSSFKWVGGTIYSILTNPVYIGEKLGTNKLEGILLQSPPIIEKNDFEDVQLLLKKSNNRTSTKFLYVLDGKTKCGCCGLTYFPHKRLNNKDNAYKCLSKRYKTKCDNYGIGIPKLNSSVWTILRTNQEQLENILEINKNKTEFEKDIKTINDKISIIQDEIKVEKKKEERIIQLYIDGIMDKEILNRNNSEIESRLKNLNDELRLSKEEIVSKRNFVSKQYTATNSLKRIKDDVHILKKTFNNVINKVVIYPIHKNEIERIFSNQQDKLVYIELFTFINLSKPIKFVISQRSKMLFSVNDEVSYYDKETKTLKLKENQFEGEEEEADIDYREIYFIENLNKTILIK
jgi:site-specific DNA recombinase